MVARITKNQFPTVNEHLWSVHVRHDCLFVVCIRGARNSNYYISAPSVSWDSSSMDAVSMKSSVVSKHSAQLRDILQAYFFLIAYSLSSRYTKCRIIHVSIFHIQLCTTTWMISKKIIVWFGWINCPLKENSLNFIKRFDDWTFGSSVRTQIFIVPVCEIWCRLTYLHEI